nr:unnamed protein product [Spirometra erinaceieuropaei]
MHSAQTRRAPYVSKDGAPHYDGLKSSTRDLISGKDAKYDQENIPNGAELVNGSNPTIPDTYVGYSNIPNQIFRRAVRKGFEFNLMVVGETGLGKSTFINSLFLTDVYNVENPGPSFKVKHTVEVRSSSVLLKENGVSLKLTVIDTPGFGDSVNNSECWQPILDFIDARFDEYLAAEGRVSRNSAAIPDKRVHACLYFIAPTGHHLKNIDAECLRRIQDKVNVIPIIGKADCMTLEECKEFKKNLLADFQHHKIKIYDFPDSEQSFENSNDEEGSRLRRLRDRMPFAVVGANTYITNSAGVKVRARTYPWGTVEVDNVEHNDFSILRYFLIRLQMQHLRELTHRVHYENYRSAKLSCIASESQFQTVDGKDPMMCMEAEKKEHEAKMRKMEAEMEAVFAQKVAEKNQKMKEFEADLAHRADQMREQLRAEESQFAAERRTFEAERSSWEEAWREWDIGADLSGSSGLSLGLGERVLNEVIKERGKTEKKRKGLF